MERGENSRVLGLKEKLGLDISEFLLKADISRATYYNIEKGEKISHKTLKNIANGLNARIEWLKTGEGEMFLPAQPKTETSVWRDALVEHLEKEIEYLRTVVLNLSGKKSFDSAIGKAAAQFVRGTNSVSANA